MVDEGFPAAPFWANWRPGTYSRPVKRCPCGLRLAPGLFESCPRYWKRPRRAGRKSSTWRPVSRLLRSRTFGQLSQPKLYEKFRFCLKLRPCSFEPLRAVSGTQQPVFVGFQDMQHPLPVGAEWSFRSPQFEPVGGLKKPKRWNEQAII